jgi:nucleoside-diphosphate-sugar epimerase
MLHPDWRCDDARFVGDGSWRPRITLREGFPSTVAWYRANGWL